MMNEQSDSHRYFRPPFWAKQDWNNGLLSEEKNDKGQWYCPKGKNNEPFDHAQMVIRQTMKANTLTLTQQQKSSP